MAIDIMNLTPTKVKPGLEGKIILLSGEKKTGKTTFLSKLPDCLIIGCEPGTNLISGAMVQPCNTWTEFKQIVKQLKSDEAKAKFKFIGIDPLGILWNLCAKFTWMQKNDGSDLSDYEIGISQNKSMNEFSSAIMDIAREGYGLVMISHITAKDVPNDIGFKYGTEIMPDLPKRPRSFIEGLADLTINVIAEPNENGQTIPYMYLRETIANGIRVKAGGRYTNLPEKAVFSYDNLVRMLDGPDTTAVGFAIGIERIITALDSDEEFKIENDIDIYVMNLTNDAFAYKLNNDLRSNGYVSEICYENKNMKQQWKIVDELNPSFVVIIGEDEMLGGYVTIKDNKTKEQTNVKNDEIIDYFNTYY